MTDDEHWAITLYRRYVELYGEPIEEQLPKRDAGDDKDVGA